MTVQDKNKLINDFVTGSKNKSPHMFIPGGFKLLIPDYRNWNSIMPVIEKIETLTTKDGRGEVNYLVTLDGTYAVISVCGESEICTYQGETRLEAAYEVVVKFIQWHNE